MLRQMIVLGVCCTALAGCSQADELGDGGADATIGSDSESTSPDVTTCESTADCDDQNPCTEGVCQVGGTCHQVARVGTACDDGSECTQGETCQEDGLCGGGLEVSGSDDPCQVCTCDAKDGFVCTPRNEGDPCDDRDCCTSNEVCLACDIETDPSCGSQGLACVGEATPCDDENDCTLDTCSCDGEVATCSSDNAPDGFPCDYSVNDCTTGDSCVAGQCILSPPMDLDDDNPCTEDKCEKGEVIYTPLLQGQCDDGDVCTMDDHCLQGACVGGDIVQCTKGPCDGSASCVSGEGCVGVPVPDGTTCDDQNPCTDGETCNADQECVADTTQDCDDGNPCTADSCDPNDGTCLNDPSALLDGAACVPSEDACAAEGACLAGVCVPAATQDCDDQNPCTTDTCDVVDGCAHTPAEGDCDDGNSCTLNDQCVDGQCEPGTWSEAETCNPPPACIEGDTVVNCGQANTLDNDGCCCFAEDPTGEYHSGHVLDLGVVEPGLEIECCIQPGFASGCEDNAYIDASSDGVNWENLATFPTTSAKNDDNAWVSQCVTVSSDVDIQFIRGANDTCYVDFFECTVLCEEEGFDCDNADCDDQNPCTADTCDTALGCVSAPDAAMEGEPCPPPDACASTGVCHDGTCVAGGPSIDCDDSDDCTEDSCDEETGCVHTTILDCDVPLCASQAAELDGLSCIEVPDFLSEGVPTYTIEFWFQPFHNDSEACLIDKVSGPGMSDVPGWMLRYNDLPGVWLSSIHYQEAKLDGNFHGLLTTDAYPPAEWHHYALVRNESGLLRRFVDGVQGGASQFNGTSFVPIHDSPDPMWIGCRDNDVHFLEGRIDEIRISAGQRYTSSFDPPTEPLENDGTTMLLYHFDDPSDGVVVDSSGLEHHGTWYGTDQRPHVSPVLSCDDGDSCTLDTCEDTGCVHTLDPCDDGDPCTADTCGGDGCVNTEDLTLDGCVPPEPCDEEVKVNCGGSCCCFIKSHTLDLGVIVEPETEVECCIRPGFNCGCTGDAVFEVSSTGLVWETVATFETVSDQTEPNCSGGAWVDFCHTFTATESYQLVKGTHDDCYNDRFECTIPGTGCDDGNRCTLDSCDDATDTCIHVPITDDATCLVLYSGNNLIAFHALPEDDASVEAVFGDLADHAIQLWSEGVVAHRLSTGEWVGNYRQLERWRGYWTVMDLSGGGFYDTPSKPPSAAIPLDGTVTPPDLRYPLHAGWNMISFAGPETTDVAGAVDAADQGLFETFVGAGIGLFKDEFGEWIGSLTFMNWRGYETKVIDGVDAFTFMWGLDVDTPSDLTYGCTDPVATNHDPAAQISDRSCAYDVPEGWHNPTWESIGTMHRPQMFTVFQSPTVNGAPLEADDAIGAFVDGENVGFGFVDAGSYLTVPAMNVDNGSEVTFRVYDVSEATTSDVVLPAPISFANHHVIVVGCTDDTALNHLADATVDSGGCTY